MKYIISAKLLQEILNILLQLPAKQVLNLINTLSTLPVMKEKKQEEPKEEKKPEEPNNRVE